MNDKNSQIKKLLKVFTTYNNNMKENKINIKKQEIADNYNEKVLLKLINKYFGGIPVNKIQDILKDKYPENFI